MTRISFIMASFNRAGFIAESIESVLAQMSAEDELVVVDDGSTDDTCEAIRPYLDRLRYQRQENAGKSVALNRGLGMTSGRYVWICDDDDLLLPGCVELLVSEFMEPLKLDTPALADAIAVEPARLQAMIDGRTRIDGELDLRLARYFRMSEGFFLRLQTSAELRTAKRALNGELDRIQPRAA
jgi:addiction module HigA family antidote